MSSDPRRLVLRALGRLERSDVAVAQSILRSVLGGPDARSLDRRDKGLITECFYGVLRWRIRLDAVIKKIARKGIPSDPELANLLRLGLFQIMMLDRVPQRAAVHSTVSIARRIRGEKVARFVNWFLRSSVREMPEPADLAEAWAHPQWMVERFRAELGDETRLEARLQANVTVPPTTIRLHPDANAPAGSTPSERVPGVYRYDGESQLLREGIEKLQWLPQDEASALAVHMLDPQPGERILEFCCGRGVKTTQIATAVGDTGSVVSFDSSEGRLAEARRLLNRWSPDVPVHIAAADCTRALPLTNSLRFDRVLVDAPCSGLGVIRRRPEILWTRTPEDIHTLAELQKLLVAEAARWVAPGGTLIYSVCTQTPEETVDVIADFNVEETVSTDPEQDGCDGFYLARLVL